MICHDITSKTQNALNETVQGIRSGREALLTHRYKKLWNDAIPERNHRRADALPASQNLLFIQTILSASESHRVCLAARGLYHRWGITPRPENRCSLVGCKYTRLSLRCQVPDLTGLFLDPHARYTIVDLLGCLSPFANAPHSVVYRGPFLCLSTPWGAYHHNRFTRATTCRPLHQNRWPDQIC